jgi:hypothetical protein
VGFTKILRFGENTSLDKVLDKLNVTVVWVTVFGEMAQNLCNAELETVLQQERLTYSAVAVAGQTVLLQFPLVDLLPLAH